MKTNKRTQTLIDGQNSNPKKIKSLNIITIDKISTTLLEKMVYLMMQNKNEPSNTETIKKMIYEEFNEEPTRIQIYQLLHEEKYFKKISRGLYIVEKKFFNFENLKFFKNDEIKEPESSRTTKEFEFCDFLIEAKLNQTQKTFEQFEQNPKNLYSKIIYILLEIGNKSITKEKCFNLSKSYFFNDPSFIDLNKIQSIIEMNENTFSYEENDQFCLSQRFINDHYYNSNDNYFKLKNPIIELHFEKYQNCMQESYEKKIQLSKEIDEILIFQQSKSDIHEQESIFEQLKSVQECKTVVDKVVFILLKFDNNPMKFLDCFEKSKSLFDIPLNHKTLVSTVYMRKDFFQLFRDDKSFNLKDSFIQDTFEKRFDGKYVQKLISKE